MIQMINTGIKIKKVDEECFTKEKILTSFLVKLKDAYSSISFERIEDKLFQGFLPY